MILTHGINSLSVGDGFPYGTVIIGGETYKTLNYNGIVWTVENLRNDVSTNVDKSPYGRLYKYSDAVYRISQSLNNGWRIPTKDDYDALIAYLGSENPLDYISTDFGGTNRNGFDVPLIGCINSNGSVLKDNSNGYIWSSTEPDSAHKWNFEVCNNYVRSTDKSASDSFYPTKLSVRLCKNM